MRYDRVYKQASLQSQMDATEATVDLIKRFTRWVGSGVLAPVKRHTKNSIDKVYSDLRNSPASGQYSKYDELLDLANKLNKRQKALGSAGAEYAAGTGAIALGGGLAGGGAYAVNKAIKSKQDNKDQQAKQDKEAQLISKVIQTDSSNNPWRDVGIVGAGTTLGGSLGYLIARKYKRNKLRSILAGALTGASLSGLGIIARDKFE